MQSYVPFRDPQDLQYPEAGDTFLALGGVACTISKCQIGLRLHRGTQCEPCRFEIRDKISSTY